MLLVLVLVLDHVLDKDLALEAQVVGVLNRAVELIQARDQMCALVLVRVEDRELAEELIRAPVLIHARVIIVAEELILVPVLVRVFTQTQAIVQTVVLLLILANHINCNRLYIC